MNLQGIDSQTLGSTKFLGEFVGNSYKAGLTTPRMNDATARKVRKYAERKLEESQALEVFQALDITTVIGLRHTQIELGEPLGKGSFSEVYSIKSFRKLSNIQTKLIPNQYVVKLLLPSLLKKPQNLGKRAADLAKEGLLLASLQHEHILSVRAWTPTMLSGFQFTGRGDSFFLVLPRLHGTLDQRLEQWSKQSKLMNFNVISRGSKKTAFLKERLEVAQAIADGLKYLHEGRIIHRDLKPANIGFDAKGVLKIFDFDSARVLPEIALVDHTSTFQLTQKVGSVRYMSPECGLGKQYNRKADVYSMGLLLYELLSLEKPYQDIKAHSHVHAVFAIGSRPIVPDSWPPIIAKLMQECWSAELEERPDMEEVHLRISHQVMLLDQGGETPASASNDGKKGWGWPFSNKDQAPPPSPMSSTRRSMKFGASFGASTPHLSAGGSRKKVVQLDKSVSDIPL